MTTVAIEAPLRVPSIGPNAVTRLAEAIEQRLGLPMARAVFDRAGVAGHLATPPATMVPEAEVLALHRALESLLDLPEALAVARAAGQATGRYVLGHRIPRPLRILLPRLPAGVSLAILLPAIARHAWTFAGSGQFHHARGRGGQPMLMILGSPFADVTPSRAYFGAAFETLLTGLLGHPIAVEPLDSMPAGTLAYRTVWL